MASISREPNGRRTLQFIGSDGIRRSIRLGKMSQRLAEGVKTRVENIVSAKAARHPLDHDTSVWIGDLDDVLHDKLSKVGLIPKRESIALKPFIDAYIASRVDVKPSTLTTFRRAKNKILEYFDPKRPIRDFTPGDADDFSRWLRNPAGGNLSEATARKTGSITKQIFQSAVRKKILRENPFADLVGTVPANRGRDYFVTREEATAVLENCPDAEWRLLFALSRYGGLRSPSETLILRWEDIDWDKNRMWVRSPKTEHHEGKNGRWVPIFPELQPYLLEVFSQCADGEQSVITRYRNYTQNLGTQLRRIVKAAGLKPWPKLWQNLRATRETELAECFPAHVVSAWIGNSVAIAAKHYLQVTEEHFERATVANSALQNPVQSMLARGRAQSKAASTNPTSRGRERQFATHCDVGENPRLGGTGLEPTTSSV